MNEVVKMDEGRALPAAQPTPMELIASALDSGKDVETLDRLMDLQERWSASQAKAEYDAAMAAMQAELPVIEKTRDGHGWKYADWGDIKRLINPVLAKYGFAVTHRIEAREKDLIVTAISSHKSGHREETSLPLPYDKTGSKNDVQSRGSTVQYGTRYTGCAITGVAVGGEDTDGATVPVQEYERVAAVKNAKGDEELQTLRTTYIEERNKKRTIGNDEWTAILQAFQEKQQ